MDTVVQGLINSLSTEKLMELHEEKETLRKATTPDGVYWWDTVTSEHEIFKVLDTYLLENMAQTYYLSLQYFKSFGFEIDRELAKRYTRELKDQENLQVSADNTTHALVSVDNLTEYIVRNYMNMNIPYFEQISAFQQAKDHLLENLPAKLFK